MANENLSQARYGEAFWRAHHEAWHRSDLNQREYCEAQGIPLKAFGNWRAKFKAEPQPLPRKFYEVDQATGSPIGAEALRRVAELYAIETTIRGQTADTRQGVRRARSLPLVEAMKVWLEKQLIRIPPRSRLADAIRYALTCGSALCRFLDDGRIELDNNTVERAIRPIALGRKDHLCAGSDGGAARWAVVASLLATAKLNHVEPFAYLKDARERMSNGHPMSHLDDLLP